MDQLPNDPDELLRQITDAGLYGQRLKPFQQRYQLGQQFLDTPSAQGRQVGSTYVAASPFEHLANAVRQFVGAKMMKDAQGGQQDLTAQLGASRQAYAQALRIAGGQAPPGTPEMLARPADPQEEQRLAMLGSLSGDPGMENAAKTMLQERHLGVQESQMQNLLRHQQILEGQGQQKIGQTERQQKTILDAYGNPVTNRTHALPGAIGAAGGSGGGATPNNGLSPEAIDKYASELAISGQMPAGVPKGRPGAAATRDITNRMMELYPDVNMSENKAGYVSNLNSLRKMQQMSDSIDAFENTALKNSRMLLDTAKGIVDTGSPFFNKPLRSIQFAAGDPNQAKFNAARQVAVQEIGKVLGGAVAGGAVTDSQRHEVEGLLSGNMTIPQMEATLQTLEADMANRKAATQAGLQAIRGRMSMKPGGAQAAAPPPAAPAPAGGAPTLSPKDAAAVDAARKRLQQNPQDPVALQVLKVNGVTP